MPLDFSVVLNYWPVLLNGLALTWAFTGICALLGSLLLAENAWALGAESAPTVARL